MTLWSEEEKYDREGNEGKEEIDLVFTAVWSSYLYQMLNIMEAIGLISHQACVEVVYSESLGCILWACFIRSSENNAIPIWYQIGTKLQFEIANIHLREV